MINDTTSNFDDFNDVDYSDFIEFEQPTTNQTPAPVSETKNTYRGIGVPESFTLSYIDIDNPPGFTGEIAQYMRDGAPRALDGGAYPLMALQMIASAAGSIRGLGGCKLSLITMTLALTASGKERVISTAKSALCDSGVAVSGDIKSDKDIVRAIIRGDGRCVYVIDEAQKFLSTDQQASYMQNVTNFAMELVTTDLYRFSELYVEDLEEANSKKITKLDKQLDAKQLDLAGLNEVFQSAEIVKVNEDISKIKAQIHKVNIHQNRVTNGIKDPSFNMATFSTPIKLADFISEDTIDSGFLGRALVCDCGSEANKLNRSMIDENGMIKIPDLEHKKQQISERIKRIHAESLKARSNLDGDASYSKVNFTANDQARRMIADIIMFYDEQEYLNHQRLGGLFRRIPERINSLCSIMAMGDANDFGLPVEINEHHVTFSLAIILNSIALLGSHLSINEGASSRVASSRLDALNNAIIKALDVKKSTDDGWRYEARIKDGISRRKWYADLVDTARRENPNQCVFSNALSQLSASGIIERNGKQIRLKI